MQIKQLIEELKKYPNNYEVTINDPSRNEGSKDIWIVEEDICFSEDGKRYIDIVTTKK